MVRGGVDGKVTSELRAEGGERVACADNWEEPSRHEEQKGPRPCGENSENVPA